MIGLTLVKAPVRRISPTADTTPCEAGGDASSDAALMPDDDDPSVDPVIPVLFRYLVTRGIDASKIKDTDMVRLPQKLMLR